MSNYFNQKSVHIIASIILIIFSFLVFAQKDSKKDDFREEVIIEENWRGFSWTNNTRRTKTFDLQDNCISEINEIWNGKRWENESWKKVTYDKLHHKTSSLLFNWNNKTGKWELKEGTCDIIDTVINKSGKVVLYNAEWEPEKKIWIASDSVFFDKKNRVSKTINREMTVSEIENDTLIVLEICEYSYQTDKVWIENNKVWRSDTKKTSSEKYRYRQLNDSPTLLYSIDYWDNRMNRWIPNTAKLFRKMENDQVVLDSVEEIIDDRSVPVFVSSKIKDESGNVIVHRYWSKSVDEETSKWNGTYVKWERNYNDKQNRYTIAESVFVADTSGSDWQLRSYQNEICKIPSAGSIVEYGDYQNSLNMWQFEKTFDTLVPCGITIVGEQYYDEEKKRWLPTLKVNSIKDADSTVITTELLDMDDGTWNNDSMFIVRSDKEGKILGRTNFVWTKSGALNENWTKVSRQTYINGKSK